VLFACPATDDFFRSRIDHMIDLRHPLAVLASRMPWQEIEARVAQVFSRKGRAGVAMPDLDLFGEQAHCAHRLTSNAGRPRVPLRIMIALLYLKHAFNESDEGVVERWARTRPGSSSRARRTLNTTAPATPPPWSSSASCWAKKVWRSCWRRPSTWPSSSS
jgi:hypothetical protein